MNIKVSRKQVLVTVLLLSLCCAGEYTALVYVFGTSGYMIQPSPWLTSPFGSASYTIGRYNSTHYFAQNCTGFGYAALEGYEFLSTNASDIILSACQSGTLFVKKAVYSITINSLTVSAKNNLKILSDGAILDFGVTNPANSHEGGWLLLSCKNVTIDGFNIGRSDRAGIKVRQSRNIHIQNNYVYSCWSGIIAESCSEVWIEDNKINTTDGDGIYVTAYPTAVNYNDTFINRNKLYNIGDTGIDVSGGTGLGRGIIIDSNIIDGYNSASDSGTPNGGGLSDASTTKDITFCNNIVKNMKYGASVNGQGTMLANNQFLDYVGGTRHGAYGVTIGSDNCTISGGLIRSARSGMLNDTVFGVRWWGGGYGNVENVMIVNLTPPTADCHSTGILLNGSSNTRTKIIGCTILDWNNASISSMSSYTCYGAILTANTCINRRGSGLTMFGICENNTGTVSWTITSNNIENVIIPISILGSSVCVDNNKGYVTKAFGNFTQSSGESLTETVTHGLSLSPDIIILNCYNSTKPTYYIVSKDATNFVITFSTGGSGAWGYYVEGKP